jgi:protein SCO1/2
MDYWEQKIASMRMKSLFLISFCLLGIACSEPSPSQIPFYNEADFTPYFLTEVAAEKQITHRISSFEFYNQDSSLVKSTSLDGKIYVANFIFTTCNNICPDMISQMKRIEKAFLGNSQVAYLSFSVTPWIDDVKTLKKYSELNQISSPQWSLLTGDKEAIYTLARKSFFAEESIGFTKDSNEFLHTEHFILVDQKGRIRGIYNGTLPLDADQCIEDIRALLAEKES